MGQSFYLSYRNSKVHYHRFGSGPKPVICFHGYGETAESFVFLDKHAGGDFTFYAIDLPFHGKTVWDKTDVFTKEDLKEIVSRIIFGSEALLTTGHSPLTVLGYSLGGRMSLALYECMPGQIEKLVLLAPDGLKINFWYWLATQTRAGNNFFALTMKKPGWFLGMLKLLNKLKLVNASIFKFVNFYIGNKEVRQQLYTRWTVLRKIKPQLSLIKSFIKKNETPVRLLYGKHDRIILSSVGEKFQKGIEERCGITVIHAGHGVLHKKHKNEILQKLRT